MSKYRSIPASFCLFSSFSHSIIKYTIWIKCRWCAWDSNPGLLHDGRRRRNHRAMTAANRNIVFVGHCAVIKKAWSFKFTVCLILKMTFHWRTYFYLKVNNVQCDQKKVAKCLQKLPKNDFTRKMIVFITFTKIA